MTLNYRLLCFHHVFMHLALSNSKKQANTLQSFSSTSSIWPKRNLLFFRFPIFYFCFFSFQQIHHLLKYHLCSGCKKRVDKNGLRLKKNSTCSEIGSIDSETVLRDEKSIKAIQMVDCNLFFEPDRLSYTDHQPLLEYYPAHVNTDSTLPSTSREAFQY